MGRRLVALLSAAVAVVGPSCGPGSGASTVTVSAAASLGEAFDRIADRFGEAHPDVEVSFDFDSSTALARRIVEGAPADVFASADEDSMAVVDREELLAGRPRVFAANELVVVTRPGNPEGITGLADLADVAVVSLCAEAAPCGRYAERVLAKAGVAIPESHVTRGQNATATLTAVGQGDADAGIVYVSDAQAAAGAVDVVTIPAPDNVVAPYVIGTLSSSGDPGSAEAFVAYVLGDDGQDILEELGFLPAP